MNPSSDSSGANPCEPPRAGTDGPRGPWRCPLDRAVPMPWVVVVLGAGVTLLSAIGRPGCVQVSPGDLVGEIILIGGLAWIVTRICRLVPWA